MAIGRSRPAPPLRTPDGARLTVTRRSGQGKPLESTAARTRSRASRTAASGRPTTVKPGRPLETWTSTETGRPRAPVRVAADMAASTPENGRVLEVSHPLRVATAQLSNRLISLHLMESPTNAQLRVDSCRYCGVHDSGSKTPDGGRVRCLLRHQVPKIAAMSVIVALSSAGVALSTGSASASVPSPTTYTDPASTVTSTVPADVCDITFDAIGGQGGSSQGGQGGEVIATVAVSPGSSYLVAVGGAGGTGTAGLSGGAASGGAGGTGYDSDLGGGGGGASLVTLGSSTSPVIVAAGGGGSSLASPGGTEIPLSPPEVTAEPPGRTASTDRIPTTRA